MRFRPTLLLPPLLLILASCERTKLYRIKATAYSSPNPAVATGENDSPGLMPPPGGARAAGVTDGSPSTTAVVPQAADESRKPGEAAAGGQDAGSTSGGGSAGSRADGNGEPRQTPP